jgi:C-terminal binding protein
MGSMPLYQVKILDSRRGSYLSEPNIEREILDAHAKVDLLCVDTAQEVIGQLEHADAIISWHHIALQADILPHLKHCRGIVRASVGYDNIDLECSARLGIPVCNVPDYGTEEVADHTLALIFALVRRLRCLDDHCRQGGWEWRTAGSILRLRDAKLGIVGFGRIGAAVAKRAQAFGMEVAFFDPYVPSGTEKAHGVLRCESLAELLERSQIVTLHVPLTPETRGFIGEAALSRVKPGAVLVNTCRGEVIDQTALIESIRDGRISQAGLDVLAGEPRVPDELRGLSQVLLSAHSAFYSDASLTELRRKAATAALRLLLGEPERNILNGVPSISRTQAPKQIDSPTERRVPWLTPV